MNREGDIYTETMAKVYADQGLWTKAAEIYRYLVTKAPARKDFADALAEAEKKIETMPPKKPETLEPLFREWLELMFEHEKLAKLKKLKKQF